MPQPDTHTFIPLLQFLFIEMGCFLKLVELGGGELRLSEEGRQVSLVCVRVDGRVSFMTGHSEWIPETKRQKQRFQRLSQPNEATTRMSYDPLEPPLFPRLCGTTTNLRLAHDPTLIQRITPLRQSVYAWEFSKPVCDKNCGMRSRGKKGGSTEPWGKWRGETERWGGKK